MAFAEMPRFGVVGAGTIGSSVARLLADAGATVIVVAPRTGGEQRARARLQHAYQSDVDAGRITAAEVSRRQDRVHVTSSFDPLSDVDGVIESVAEDLQTKQQVIAEIERVAPADCLIASNTSSIPITTIAETAVRRERIIGSHFFWPAHRYRLVEIATGQATSTETLERTLAIARWLEKVPLLVRDSPGFFTTRVLLVYLNETLDLVAQGARIDQVDSAMRAFGWRMGPFRLLDAVGIEIFQGIYHAVSKHLGERIQHLPRLWPLLEVAPSALDPAKGCRRKRFYADEDRGGVPPSVYSLLGCSRKEPSSIEELTCRPVWQLINEIGHCLDEGIVSSPEEAERGAILGIGWPEARGGPLGYARRTGLREIVRALEMWSKAHGRRFLPSRFLCRLARTETLHAV